MWLKESVTNTPPFTHDLVRLAEETGVELNPEQIDFLSVINSWNIRGRYPDFTKSLHHSATPEYVKVQVQKVSDLKKWLEQKI